MRQLTKKKKVHLARIVTTTIAKERRVLVLKITIYQKGTFFVLFTAAVIDVCSHLHNLCHGLLVLPQVLMVDTLIIHCGYGRFVNVVILTENTKCFEKTAIYLSCQYRVVH